MGAIYSGCLAKDGYLFTTNMTCGSNIKECSIIEVNRLCGALVVAANKNLLARVINLFNKIAPLLKENNGLSLDLAEDIGKLFEYEFKDNSGFKTNPLPFLFLLIGYAHGRDDYIDHIFMRNRVVDVIDNGADREYITGLDINHPVRADNLYFGYSELVQYINRFSFDNLDLKEAKILSSFAFKETKEIDSSIFPDTRMAVISYEKGFEWVKDDELNILLDKAKMLKKRVSEKLAQFF